MEEFTPLFIHMISGMIGMGYMLNGKKQHNPIPLAVGVALCTVPYFITSSLLTIITVMILMFIPKYIKI